MQPVEMKNILIPTDFSGNSLNAVTYAMSFFKDKVISFYLLHVSLLEEIDKKVCYYKFSDTVLDEKILYNPIVKLQEEVRKIKKLSVGKQHSFHCIHENVQFIEAIRKNVEEKEIDYIVMGTKGASRRINSVLGSQTTAVITRVKCTILVIPEYAKYTRPKNVVFPTDFNNFYKGSLLDTLAEFLKIQNTSLSVLHVSRKVYDLTQYQKKNRNYLEDYLQDKPHSFYYITDENIDNAIEAFVKKTQVDMIAMIAKNLNFFQRILFQPMVEKISYHAKIPFLVLHE
jgi:nucleotide-binding universal stress UspA family protein